MSNTKDNKQNSFVMYDSWSVIFNALSDEEAGKFIKAIYEFQTGKIDPKSDPVFENKYLLGYWELIKGAFVLNAQRWEETKQKRVNAANARWGKDKKEKEELEQYRTAVATNYTEQENTTATENENATENYSVDWLNNEQ